ncbi:MAG: hypothetical protein RIR43_635, partial [Pseudomonadota bacterium]
VDRVIVVLSGMFLPYMTFLKP